MSGKHEAGRGAHGAGRGCWQCWALAGEGRPAAVTSSEGRSGWARSWAALPREGAPRSVGFSCELGRQ